MDDLQIGAVVHHQDSTFVGFALEFERSANVLAIRANGQYPSADNEVGELCAPRLTSASPDGNLLHRLAGQSTLLDRVTYFDE